MALSVVCAPANGLCRHEASQNYVRCLDRAHHGRSHSVAPWRLGLHREHNTYTPCREGRRLGAEAITVTVRKWLEGEVDSAMVKAAAQTQPSVQVAVEDVNGGRIEGAAASTLR